MFPDQLNIISVVIQYVGLELVHRKQKEFTPTKGQARIPKGSDGRQRDTGV